MQPRRPSGALPLRQALAGLCMSVAGALVTRLAGADAPTGLTLRWDAPPECPQASAVLKRVRALEGSAPPRRLAAEGTIVRDGTRYRIRLVVHDDAGTSERAIDAASCSDLAGAAAVHLALLLQGAEPPSEGTTSSTATSSASDAASAKTAPSNPAKDQHPAAESAALPARSSSEQATPHAAETRTAERARSWHVGLVAPLGTLNLGPSPKPSFGIGAAVSFAFRDFELMVAGEVDAKQRFVPAGAPDYATVVKRQAGSAGLCYRWRFRTVDLAPCAAIWLEHVSARGEGPDVVVRTPQAWWVSPAAAGLARWHWAPALALIGSLTLRLEGARPQLSLEGLEETVQFGPVALAFALGTEWIF